MGRFLLTLVVGLALFLGVAWWFDLFVHAPDGNGANKADKDAKLDAQLGVALYAGQALPPEPPFHPDPKSADPITIASHWVALDKTELACQVDGQILFIGQQIPDDLLALAGVAPFAADPFLYARVNQGGSDLTIIYRRLRENEMVDKHEMLAVLDPAKAMNEVAIKQAKIAVAEEDYKGSYKTFLEAENRFQTARKLFERNPPLIGFEEYSEKKLARDKFETEGAAKKAAIVVSRAEADTAQIILKQHYIRNPIDRAFLKSIYHNRGDSVKNQDPILQLYSTDRLQAEGFVEVQYRDRLREGMPVIIEPTVEDGPFRTLSGHRGEVNGVAVSKDSGLFVSVSDDRTACVWVKEMPAPKWVLQHSDPVRSVACTPPLSKQNWCVTGCSNGSIHVWDLDNPGTPPMKPIQDAHRDAVTALAFSPDGAYFASGSADNMIHIWKTGEEKPLYAIEDHGPAGPVTSLAFTPQARLVAASRDNSLRVWELREKGAKIVGEPIGGRSGNVNQLGVSQDGRWMLFDQGKTLQLLSVQDGKTVSILQNIAGGTSFETLALFSPDGTLMLTAGAAEGRLQVWRTPTSYTRGYEVRQLVSEDKSAVTCAAFAPDAGLAAAGIASLAITGSKDGKVYLWAVPGKQAVENHRIRNATLTMVGRSVEGGTNRVRVGVQVRNPDGRFMDGRPATIVIEP